VFVAAGADERLPARVLEYSIKRHATMSVDLSLLMDPPPTTGAPAGDALPASALARFRVPSLRGYRGRALYLEADMLVLDDLGKLWDERLEDCDLACPAGGPGSAPAARPSVLLMDCSRLSWTIQDVVRGLEEGRYSLPRLLDEYHLAPGGRIRASLPAEWHCAERHEPGKTRLLHYADRSRQPWRTPAGAWGAPWYQALREALAEGFIRRDEVKEEIEMGHVAPGLLGQLDRPVSTSDRP
jgi:hypothetical protein